MPIYKAEFLQSNTDYKNCPKPDKPEYAFIGRSNVGKSSLINMLTNHSKLAKVSAKPGKTRLINHFFIDDNWYLVDLPGYGYAKVSKTEKDDWGAMIKEYLLHRENLQCIFVLIDSRLEPQKIDLEFIEWLGTQGIPFSIVFTKTDKQSVSKTNKNITFFKQKMLETWEELPETFQTSTIKLSGKEEIINYIKDLNQSFGINK